MIPFPGKLEIDSVIVCCYTLFVLTQITPLEDCLKGSNFLRKYNLLCICDVLTLYVQYLQTIAEGTLVEELKRQIHSTLVGISFSLKMCETE